MQSEIQGLKNRGKLIIIYGLPGSGKTTFAQKLKRSGFNQYLLIQGDKIQAQFFKNQLISKNLISNQQILKFYKQIETKESERVKFDPQIWKQSRKFIQKSIEKLIRQGHKIILEDDLLYRSQRKPYRKISWHLQCFYVQILMNTTIQQCKNNIKQRSINKPQDQIPGQVVEKANQKLEVVKQDWEFTINLSLSERTNFNKSMIQEKMKIIEIRPNDPNDSQYRKIKKQYMHSRQEELQIILKRFVGQIMKNGLKSINRQIKGLEKDKKKLANILGEWKKNYVKDKNRTTDRQIIEQSLKTYIDQQIQK